MEEEEETGERRSAGNPTAFAVEASQAAMELVSSLYCWYVLTRAEGNILESSQKWSLYNFTGKMRWRRWKDLICNLVPWTMRFL